MDPFIQTAQIYKARQKAQHIDLVIHTLMDLHDLFFTPSKFSAHSCKIRSFFSAIAAGNNADPLLFLHFRCLYRGKLLYDRHQPPIRGDRLIIKDQQAPVSRKHFRHTFWVCCLDLCCQILYTVIRLHIDFIIKFTKNCLIPDRADTKSLHRITSSHETREGVCFRTLLRGKFYYDSNQKGTMC